MQEMLQLLLQPYDDASEQQREPALPQSGEAAQEPHSLGAPCPPGQPHHPQQAVLADRPWRCLHAAHPARCASCLPAPALEEADCFEVLSDPGKRNGEKRLKAALILLPEWHSQPAREAAAAAAEGAGVPNLAASLRRKHSTSLHKARGPAPCVRLEEPPAPPPGAEPALCSSHSHSAPRQALLNPPPRPPCRCAAACRRASSSSSTAGATHPTSGDSARLGTSAGARWSRAHRRGRGAAPPLRSRRCRRCCRRRRTTGPCSGTRRSG